MCTGLLIPSESAEGEGIARGGGGGVKGFVQRGWGSYQWHAIVTRVR